MIFASAARASLLLAALLATDTKAAELSASAGLAASLSKTFSDRALLSFSAAFPIAEHVAVSADLGLSLPVGISARALGPPDGTRLGSLVQVSPGARFWTGGSFGPLQARAGLGLAYHLRFVSTDASAVGRPVVPGESRFGTLAKLDANDHPGLEGAVQLWLPLGDRLSAGLQAGFHYASVRIYATPAEATDLVIAREDRLSAVSVQLSLAWRD